jgi:hypothetical protein
MTKATKRCTDDFISNFKFYFLIFRFLCVFLLKAIGSAVVSLAETGLTGTRDLEVSKWSQAPFIKIFSNIRYSSYIL